MSAAFPPPAEGSEPHEMLPPSKVIVYPTASPSRKRSRWRTVATVAPVAAVSGLIGAVIGIRVADDDGPARPSTALPVSVAPQADGDLSRLDVGAVAGSVGPSVVTVSADIERSGVEGESLGTGVVLTADGEILTNAHVVEGAADVRVRLPGESDPRAAELVALDAGNDLALLRIDVDDLTPVTFADPASLKLGDEVVAIGFALDLDGAPSVTLGIVSAVDRTLVTDVGALDGLVQTDAAISSGNSGGPLVNALGQVVGINTAVARGDVITAANNIGFAIGAGEVLRVIDDLRVRGDGGERVQGYLGVGLTDRTDGGQGAVIAEVEDGSPADGAGLQVDDIVLEIDGTTVDGQAGLIAAIRDSSPGDDVEILIERNGNRETRTATLVERPDG